MPKGQQGHVREVHLVICCSLHREITAVTQFAPKCLSSAPPADLLHSAEIFANYSRRMIAKALEAYDVSIMLRSPRCLVCCSISCAPSRFAECTRGTLQGTLRRRCKAWIDTAIGWNIPSKKFHSKFHPKRQIIMEFWGSYHATAINCSDSYVS